MGLAAATVNQQYMIAYKNDLEYKISLIDQAKMNLSESANDLLTVGSDLDPDNPMVKQLEKRRERLNLLEKKLDMERHEYQVKLEMIEKGMGENEKMIQSNIKGHGGG